MTAPGGANLLFWDGKGRLCIIFDYDSQGNGLSPWVSAQRSALKW